LGGLQRSIENSDGKVHDSRLVKKNKKINKKNLNILIIEKKIISYERI
jgi:hypothetical protein